MTPLLLFCINICSGFGPSSARAACPIRQFCTHARPRRCVANNNPHLVRSYQPLLFPIPLRTQPRVSGRAEDAVSGLFPTSSSLTTSGRAAISTYCERDCTGVINPLIFLQGREPCFIQARFNSSIEFSDEYWSILGSWYFLHLISERLVVYVFEKREKMRNACTIYLTCCIPV
jgi:hypothetical protein